MAKLSIESGEKPKIQVVSVAGDLTIRGWDHDEVVINVPEEDSASLSTVGDVIEINSNMPCSVSIPYNADLEIKDVSGTATVKNIEGLLTIHKVAGNLSLRGTRAAVVDAVGAELSARRVDGDLRVTSVRGNVTLRDLDGDFSAKSINGQLNCKRVSGNIQANTKGNAGLAFGLEIGDQIEVHADGNIHCRIPESIPLTVNFSSNANAINVRTPELRENFNESTYEYKSGEGGPSITLTAKGRIDFRTMVTDDDFGDEIDVDFFSELGGYAADITQQISDQVQNQIDVLTHQLNDRLAHLTDLGDVEKKAQATARKAERKLASAQRRLEIKLAAAQRRAEVNSKRSGSMSDRQRHRSAEERKAKSRVDPISAEERRTILEMVAANKITVEEADKLLAALEGRVEEK